MMLAFLVDQVQLLTSSIVLEGFLAKKQLKRFYQTLREYFFLLAFDNWEHLYTALAYGINVSFTVRNPGLNSSLNFKGQARNSLSELNRVGKMPGL